MLEWHFTTTEMMQGSRTYGKPVRPSSSSGHGRALKELGGTFTDGGYFWTSQLIVIL